MPFIGIALLGFVIWFGFRERAADTVVSAFDPHALLIVLGGSLAAVAMGSSAQVAWRTFAALVDLLPVGRFASSTRRLDEQRIAVANAWREGRRAQAIQLVEAEPSPELNAMLQLILQRAPEQASAKAFFELKAAALSRLQPAAHNWEMLSKLGPAMGMVGTITGMVALFKNMSSENLNIGASMSLALLATLYGVAFGAGIAGPIANRLNHLLDDRLGVLDGCEKTVNEIVALGDR